MSGKRIEVRKPRGPIRKNAGKKPEKKGNQGNHGGKKQVRKGPKRANKKPRKRNNGGGPPLQIIGTRVAGGKIELRYRLRKIGRLTHVSDSITAAFARAAAAAALDKTGNTTRRLALLATRGDNEIHTSVIGEAVTGEAAVGTGLSDCAALFAKAIANPFGRFDKLPCVPCSPPVETQRWRSAIRGVCQTGTAALGYVMVAPYVAGNDYTKVTTTGSTYTGGLGANPAFSGVGIAAILDPGLPYTTANLTNGIVARLVGLGLRWRNITKASDVGGTITVVQLQDGDSAVNYTLEQIQAMQNAVMVPQALNALPIGDIENTWQTLVWRPQDMSSLDFIPDSGMASKNTDATFIIVLDCPGATSTMSIQWELVEFFEYAGIAVSGGVITAPPELLVSDADTVGLDRVLAGAQRIPLSCDPKDWCTQMSVGVVEAMAHSDSAARTVEDLTGSGGLGTRAINTIVDTLFSFLAA